MAGSSIGPYAESMKQQLTLENKVCLVTGGTRGIGRAIAEMLLDEGAMVVVCGRWPDSVTRAVAEMAARWPGKVKGKAADVSEHEDVHALFEFVDRETGGLDVLVNNAGVGIFAKVSRITLEEWDKMIHTNLTGASIARGKLCQDLTPGARDTSSISAVWPARTPSRADLLITLQSLV